MKAFIKSTYKHYAVSKCFNEIIESNSKGCDGSKKEQLKSFLIDLQNSGFISGMIGDFIYHTDCKAFYITPIEYLENIKNELEQSFDAPIENRYKSPHYTFMCWLCFEEYCYDLYKNTFE